jgi:serine/threonine protein kinase
MHLGGRYKLLSTPLSTGSFGSVFMADDERMPRRVAVKILHPQHAENPTVRARFRRELEAACRVSHENVVSVFDIGEDPRLGLYYVMELVRGTSLKDYLNGEPLPWIFVHRVATQITRALHAIHSAGIVHRDLKPQNIMLVERSSLEELVKVLDFGIASLKSPDEDRRDVELTGARMVLGTPPYMSPEQTYMRSDRERLGLDVDTRSDVYSLGVILYEMVAGRRPFSGDSHDIVVAHRLTRPMPLDKMVGVAVPREFSDMVMRCLSKDPNERPQSAKDILQTLRESELKPVRRWNESVVPDEEQDLPTMGEHVALPLEAVSVDTRPRLELPPRKRSRPLWAPLGALGVGAVAAVIAFTGSPPEVDNAVPIEVAPSRGRLAPSADLPSAPGGQSATIGAPSPTTASAEVEVEILREAKADPANATRSEAQADPANAAPVAEPVVAQAPAPEPVVAIAPSAGAGTSAGAAIAPAVPGPEVAARVATAEPSRVVAVRPKVGVMLTTQPPGAVVVVDGQALGLTPVTLSFDLVELRDLELVLQKERFEDLSVVLPLRPELSGQTLVVHHTLEKKKARGTVDPFKDL